MSIYPKGVDTERLMYKFDIAALNLPIPDDLTRYSDAREWSAYVGNLSPAQLVRDFGTALDQLHALTPAGRDLRAAPEPEQAKVYSKWMAASCLMSELLGKFHFETAETYRNPDKFYKSDIEQTVYTLVDFLKGVNSADVPVWEARQQRHAGIEHDGLIAVINKFDDKHRKQAAKASPSPKAF